MLNTPTAEELKKRLKEASVRLQGEGEPAGSDFVTAVTALIEAAIPASTSSAVSLNLTELHEEIKWQGDEFNQIDTKVGITLGFVLIFAGQIFTLFTAKRTDLAPFLHALNDHPWAYLLLYGFIATITISLVFGVASRWPRDFRGSAIAKVGDEALATTLLDEGQIVTALREAITKNRPIIEEKSKNGKLCHLFAGISLLGVVVLVIASIIYQQLYG